MISAFSLFSALILYNLMLIVICKLYKRNGVLEAGGWPVLLFGCFAATMRLACPIEIPFPHAVFAWEVLGTAHRFLRFVPILMYLLLAVWAAGALRYMARDIRKLYRSYRRCHEFTTFESKYWEEFVRRQGAKGRVLLSPQVTEPYVIGFVRHTIYLPYPEMDDEETELILEHEAQHIKSRDSLIKLFCGLFSEAVWWNFLSEDFQKMIDALLEMRCDKRVTKHMSEKRKTKYLNVLAKIADRSVSEKEALVLGMNESFAAYRQDGVLEQRFKVINADSRGESRRYISVLGKCAIVALFLVSYLVIIQSAIDPEINALQDDSRTHYREDYYDPKVGDELSNAFILKGSDGRYQLCINYEFVRYLSDEEVSSEKYKDLYIFEEDRQR